MVYLRIDIRVEAIASSGGQRCYRKAIRRSLPMNCSRPFSTICGVGTLSRLKCAIRVLAFRVLVGGEWISPTQAVPARDMLADSHDQLSIFGLASTHLPQQSSSAGGQSEHPSDVKSSIRTAEGCGKRGLRRAGLPMISRGACRVRLSQQQGQSSVCNRRGSSVSFLKSSTNGHATGELRRDTQPTSRRIRERRCR